MQQRRLLTFGSRPFVNKDPNVTYILCDDEAHLLRSFLAYWRKNLPEVITGWNSQMYDIPYLAGRINRVLGEKSMKDLSPWGLVSQDEVYISGRKNITYDIGGVTQLDYLDLYKRFTYTNQESYRLDYIANYELGEKNSTMMSMILSVSSIQKIGISLFDTILLTFNLLTNLKTS